MKIKYQPVLPYSDSALRWDLRRVHDVWRKVRRDHDRFSVYRYLTAVFNLVMVWEKENSTVERATRALRSIGHVNEGIVEPFAAVIRCTSNLKFADAKARSKWARALMFAAKYKSPAEPLKRFIHRNGGINGSASDLSRLSRHRSPNGRA